MISPTAIIMISPIPFGATGIATSPSAARFGLVHVDYKTLKRTPKDSALWYRDHIREAGRP